MSCQNEEREKYMRIYDIDKSTACAIEPRRIFPAYQRVHRKNQRNAGLWLAESNLRGSMAYKLDVSILSKMNEELEIFEKSRDIQNVGLEKTLSILKNRGKLLFDSHFDSTSA